MRERDRSMWRETEYHKLIYLLALSGSVYAWFSNSVRQLVVLRFGARTANGAAWFELEPDQRCKQINMYTFPTMSANKQTGGVDMKDMVEEAGNDGGRTSEDEEEWRDEEEGEWKDEDEEEGEGEEEERKNAENEEEEKGHEENNDIAELVDTALRKMSDSTQSIFQDLTGEDVSEKLQFVDDMFSSFRTPNLEMYEKRIDKMPMFTETQPANTQQYFLWASRKDGWLCEIEGEELQKKLQHFLKVPVKVHTISQMGFLHTLKESRMKDLTPHKRVYLLRYLINKASKVGIVLCAQHIINFTHLTTDRQAQASSEDSYVDNTKSYRCFLFELIYREDYNGAVIPSPENPISSQLKIPYLVFMWHMGIPTANARAIFPASMKRKALENLILTRINCSKNKKVIGKQMFSMSAHNVVTMDKNDYKDKIAKIIKICKKRAVPCFVLVDHALTAFEWKVSMFGGKVCGIQAIADCKKGTKANPLDLKTPQARKLKAFVAKVYAAYRHMTGAILEAVRFDVMEMAEGEFFLNEIECEGAVGLEKVSSIDYKYAVNVVAVCKWLIRERERILSLHPADLTAEFQEEQESIYERMQRNPRRR
jgi:hypothetical protein